MEQIIKQTREVGTSAGVLLPRSWLNREVVVTLLKPSIKDISLDVIEIILDRNFLKDIIGIFLFGSYARNEEDYSSDVDIIGITKNTNKLIKQNNYDILLVSEKNFLKNLSTNLMYLSGIYEAIPILNESLLEKYKSMNLKINLKENIKEISQMQKINQNSLKIYKRFNKNVPDGIIYSIVLRLRELYLIKNLNSKSNKPDFIKIVGLNLYSAYNRIKNNKAEENNVSVNEAEEALKLSFKWLKELKGLKKE